MSLSPAFEISQTNGQSSIMTVTDTSTGSDGAINKRRVYAQKIDGTYLVEDGTTTDYELWDYSDGAIALDILDKDYALSVKVEWVNNANVVLYTLTQTFGLTLHNEAHDYGLTSLLSSNPYLLNEGNFFKNKSDLRVLIDSGNTALEYNDRTAAQLCYDQATAIRLQSPLSF
jgi:hypothetical protein